MKLIREMFDDFEILTEGKNKELKIKGVFIDVRNDVCCLKITCVLIDVRDDV